MDYWIKTIFSTISIWCYKFPLSTACSCWTAVVIVAQSGFALDLRGKTLNLPPLTITLTIDFFIVFVRLREFPSIFSVLNVVFVKNICWILSSAFITLLELIICFLCCYVEMGWIDKIWIFHVIFLQHIVP